jgi:polyketide biosynthesis enoyl-CoA hydratase PksH
MRYESIQLAENGAQLRISLARPHKNNSIDDVLLRELHLALDVAERAPECRVVVLQSQDGVFCTGLDFESVVKAGPAESAARRGQMFFSLLRRFSQIPRVVACAVDGHVAAGGVGLVAACDLVFATDRASFSLPEALWGLLPCSVLPFLLRRVGFQRAYAMTLSTQPLSAAQALQSALVDELAPDLEGPLRKLTLRVSRIEPSVIGGAKRYFDRLAGVSPEIERIALGEFDRLMSSQVVRENIERFVTTRRFPWEQSAT